MREPQFPLRVAFLTHEPFYPPSGGGSAEAVYLVGEMVRRGHEVHVFCPRIANAETVSEDLGVRLNQFDTWEMGRYARWRNLKYLAYPFLLERMVARAARQTRFHLLVSQHAISAVAAGKLKRKLDVPVVMNFPDLLTGFMESWPGWLAPRPVVVALKRYEISLPVRYGVDGVMTVSDTLADLFAERGVSREKVLPIYYGYSAGHFPFRSPPSDGAPPVVVMHGSFDAHHLGPIALEAMRFVTERRPGVTFRFIGKRTAVLKNFLDRAQAQIPGFKFQATGFVPYSEVSKHLADASVGIVPYEDSSGAHCAFVAKIVEYVASGLPAVSTPLQSIQRYFQNDPMIRFAKFDGADFGGKIIAWLGEPASAWQFDACKSAARVQAELEWEPLCHRAVNFIEATCANAAR